MRGSKKWRSPADDGQPTPAFLWGSSPVEGEPLLAESEENPRDPVPEATQTSQSGQSMWPKEDGPSTAVSPGVRKDSEEPQIIFEPEKPIRERPAIPTAATLGPVDARTPENFSAVMAEAQVPEAAEVVSTPVSEPALPPDELLPPSPIEDLIVTEKTTFQSRPWWTPFKWTQLPEVGEAANDVRTAYGVGTGVAALACSLRGRRHRQYAGPNQDAFDIGLVKVDENCEFLVVVVCDGMGSAPFSSYGSTRVASLISELIRTLITSKNLRDIDAVEEQLRGLQSQILDKMTREALEARPAGLSVFSTSIPPSESGPGDIQTTLTFAVIQNVRDDASEVSEMEAVIGMIGDSPALNITTEGPRLLENDQDSSGVFSTATNGAVGASAWRLTRTTVGEKQPLLIATDGVANYLVHEGTPTRLGKYVAKQWISPLPVLEFIRDVSFDLASADDDRTAIMIWLNRG